MSVSDQHPTAPDPDRIEAGGDGAHATSLGARALRGVGWSWLTLVVRALLSLLVLAILSRLLTPRDFGLIGMAWVLMELATRFGQTGIGHALIQRGDLTARHVETGFTLSLALGGAMTATVWLLAPLFGRFFDEPMVTRPLQALAIAFVIAGAGVVPGHLLRRNLRFKPLMVADLLAYSVGYGLTATVLAFRGFGVWAFVWGELVRVLVHTGTVILYSPPRLRLRLAAREAADLVFRGAGLSFVQVFDFIVRMGGYFIVGRWLGVTSLGYYTRADRLASLPFQYAGGSLFEVAFPAMAQRQRQVDRLRTVYLHGAEMLSLAMLPMGVMMLVGAPEIVAAVLGGQWDATVSVLQILALAVPFQTCGILNVAAVRASGAVIGETWRQAAHAVLVVLGAWLGSRWGLVGVAVAIVGAQIIAYLLMAQAALPLLGLRWRHLLRCHLPALWTGAWTALALWLAAEGLRALEWPAVLALAVEIVVWGVAVVTAVYHAPSFVRPLSISWALAHLPFEALGAPGRHMRSVLEWLSASHDPN